MSDETDDSQPGFWRQLLSLRGRLDRGPYALAGVVFAAVKYQLDRWVAGTYFDRDWSPLNYYVEAEPILELAGAEQAFFATMLALTVPFAAVGVWLTARRLHSVGWPAWWSALFFIPVVNVVTFLVLCVVRSREGRRFAEPRDRANRLTTNLIPESKSGAVGLALVATVPVGFGAALLGVWGLETYGWGLFVGIPFWLGMGSTVIYGYHRERSYFECVVVALFSTAVLAGLLFVLAIEGAVCIVMAAPLAAVIAVVGASVGYFIQAAAFDQSVSAAALLAVFAAVPFVMGLESADPSPPPLMKVESTVEIDAPPEVVWRHVVTFEDLPPPKDWIFETGIAYPTRATIEGRGRGAVRRCVFSTGAFVEPIRVWDEPHRLAFDVRRQPAAMEETSPWGAIDAPHVDSFFRSQRGEFRLTETADGGTRLVGRTWYRHRVWPASYWGLWSDRIVHRIHMRVLRHIKREATP